MYMHIRLSHHKLESNHAIASCAHVAILPNKVHRSLIRCSQLEYATHTALCVQCSEDSFYTIYVQCDHCVVAMHMIAS